MMNHKVKIIIHAFMCMFMLSVGHAAAQTGSISGRVVDQNRTPISGLHIHVFVSCIGEPISAAITDADGNYQCTNVPVGSYHVVALESR